MLLINSIILVARDVRADSYQLEIEEASCSLCTLELVNKFSKIRGVEDVTIEPQKQTVTVKLYGEMTIPEDVINRKVKEANLTLLKIKHIKASIR